MLRLVSSARSRLIRAGAFRAAGAAVPGATRLDVEQVPSHRRYVAPRCFCSDANDHDRPWRYLAVYSPVAWQETVKPALLTFLKLNKHLMVPVKLVDNESLSPMETRRGQKQRGSIPWANMACGYGSSGEREATGSTSNNLRSWRRWSSLGIGPNTSGTASSCQQCGGSTT
ncbi:hypothetical protein PF007_g30158 [Phytophthora fragariae]|uniref:Uncharacterized protein n=2 Tax=Phytophthora fragariae TaxID=53985 RepID=A0A6A4AZX8_9STRA|nr:hypothetical protein PF007_g30158 [Phytophthora fragariae]KAE9265606.1 hypothetical protein PF001_g30818 [Phytophthora fragariae]